LDDAHKTCPLLLPIALLPFLAYAWNLFGEGGMKKAGTP
jgi:hypothetical protein